MSVWILGLHIPLDDWSCYKAGRQDEKVLRGRPTRVTEKAERVDSVVEPKWKRTLVVIAKRRVMSERRLTRSDDDENVCIGSPTSVHGRN